MNETISFIARRASRPVRMRGRGRGCVGVSRPCFLAILKHLLRLNRLLERCGLVVGCLGEA